MWAVAEVSVGLTCGVVSFYGLDNFIGYWVEGLFQLFWGRGRDFWELGHCPLFDLWWSALKLSWCLWVCNLACWCAEVKVLVTQLSPTLCEPMDCSLPDSSVHGILQARILDCVAIPFSRGSSWPRDQTQVSCIVGRFFTIWATRE